jgi:hypothetical protein
MASSPWSQAGELHATYDRGLQIDPATGRAAHRDVLVAQLPSWALYEGWDQATLLPMWPGGPCFAAKTQPIISEEKARALIELDPETGRVEYLAQFASGVHAYLPNSIVDRIFSPWNGRQLEIAAAGTMAHAYVAHGDASKVGDNYAFAIAHLETHDDVPHVVFDVLTHWDPADFPGHIIDYAHIENEIFGYLQRFAVRDLTFDQYGSAQTIQNLQHRVSQHHGYAPARIYERTATAPSNWKDAETFKRAALLDLVHAPFYEQADQELRHLQVKNHRVAAPTTGPVKSDDLADVMFACVAKLIGENPELLFERLASIRLGRTLAGGLPIMSAGPASGRPGAGGGAADPIAEQFSAFGASRRRPAGSPGDMRARGHRHGR